MSARRHAAVLAAAASATGPVNVRTTGLAGSSASRSNGSGGGGTTSAIRPQSSSRAPIWKSAPSGPAISSATNCLSGVPRDPPDDLADEVALVERVVARRRARLPPRRLRGEPRRPSSPSRTCPRPTNGWSQPETPEVCDIRCRTSTPSLPFAANSGQYFADRRVDVELAAVDQDERGQAGHRLRGRPDVDDRVLGPRRRPLDVGAAAPDVDDGLAVEVDGHRRAELLAARGCARAPPAPPRTGRRNFRGSRPSGTLLSKARRCAGEDETTVTEAPTTPVQPSCVNSA